MGRMLTYTRQRLGTELALDRPRRRHARRVILVIWRCLGPVMCGLSSSVHHAESIGRVGEISREMQAR